MSIMVYSVVYYENENSMCWMDCISVVKREYRGRKVPFLGEKRQWDRYSIGGIQRYEWYCFWI